MQKITILIPVYTEVNTLEEILNKDENTDFCGLEKEIILIDDCFLYELYSNCSRELCYRRMPKN